MIWLLTAMKCEGEKIPGILDSDMAHIVTGIGPGNAAFALRKLIDSGRCTPFDKILNVGVCGAGDDVPAGKLFFIDKITDMVSGRDYYPDLALFPSDIEESQIYTSDDIVRDPEPGKLYDEEAAAIFEAGQKYFSPDSMVFMKVVSDHGDDLPTKARVEELILEKEDIIRSAALTLLARSEEQKEQAGILDLKEDLCLTEAMNNDMKNLLRYAKAKGSLDLVESYMEDLRRQGKVPVKNKKEGAYHAGKIKDILGV